MLSAVRRSIDRPSKAPIAAFQLAFAPRALIEHVHVANAVMLGRVLLDTHFGAHASTHEVAIVEAERVVIDLGVVLVARAAAILRRLFFGLGLSLAKRFLEIFALLFLRGL